MYPTFELDGKNTKFMLALASLILTHSTAWAETILITDTHHPIPTTKEVRTITLDLPATLEAELSTNLPVDPVTAQTIAQQLLTPCAFRPPDPSPSGHHRCLEHGRHPHSGGGGR